MGDRDRHSFLAGAKISLSGVNITGREFDSYKPEELAFIVMRYMVQYAEGNLYSGPVSGVFKKLWPDDHEKITPNIAKKIYRFLKIYGFRHYVDNFGEDCWRVSVDIIDRGYREQIPVKKVVNPVTYRCGICGAGPWDNREEFLAHHESSHKEKELVTISNGDESKKYICDICGAEFPNSSAIAGHMNHHYVDEGIPRPEIEDRKDGVPCKICGKKILPQGMGTHKKKHTMNSNMKKLYETVKQYEGLSPKEYAELLDMDREKVVRLAGALRDRKKIKSVGLRSSARYYLDKRRVSKPKTDEVVVPEEVSEPIEPQAVAEIPDMIVQVLGAENVFKTNDGKTWMFKEGELYLVTLEKVAGK